MTVVDLPLSGNVNKHFAENARSISKIRLLKKDSNLWFTIGPKERGGHGFGRYHEVIELFFDSDNRLFIGYKTKDRSGHFYQYAIIGQLQEVTT